uniref:Malectin-like domain-containing protein n=1 Tax=Quercus lobata TaxID=97700 RepID=A0A7N2RFG5_QUELO
MPIKIIMDYALELIFILKALRVVVLVIGILGNWKLAEGDNEHARRKLVDYVPGFISIDCGATEDYLDDVSGIFYKSDTVRRVFTLDLDQHEVYTLRLFDAIHVPTSDIIYVCFINTGSGIPFISALELRPLDKSLYPFDFGALKFGWRFDLGTTTGQQLPIR